MDLEQRMADWDGLGLVSRHDAATGAWIFIALHDDTLGRPVGGTRLKRYAQPADGLLDAQRLAAGMTHKWASVDLPFGGGKAVLALSRALDAAERRGLLERYADLLKSLGGVFSTGQDLGTSPEDMLVVAQRSSLVHGYDAERKVMRDPGPFTALGVFSGIQAAAAHVAPGGFSGMSVLIQGVGGVGGPLARRLREAGFQLLLSDVDEARARALAEELSGRVVAADEVVTTPCDIYAPCAVGATLDERTVPELACRIVAGSANNQLQHRSIAAALHERGILYAPDYVINAGGAVAFGLRTLGEQDDDVLRARVTDLGPQLARIFAEAAERDESPLATAERIVRRRLDRAS